MRAAIYARVSTAEQDVGLQVEELRNAAQQRNWSVVGEYLDAGISGSKQDRPGLDQMMDDARSGRVDVVLVWKLDRLGRSLHHLLRLLDALTAYGVAFASLRDPGIDTTSTTGRLMLQMLGAFAEFERAQIRERAMAGVARARRLGKRIGRPCRPVDMDRVTQLLDAGRSQRSIAMALKVPRGTLRDALARAGGNPPRKTNPGTRDGTKGQVGMPQTTTFSSTDSTSRQRKVSRRGRRGVGHG